MDTSLLCNPNLLDNSNFQINQRDIAGLQTGGTWLQDKWFCATGNIEVMDGYIILKNPAALGQRLEEGLETGYYTISAKTNPGHTVSFSLGNWAGTEQNAYAVANADGYVSATLSLTHENNKKSFIYIHAAGSDVPIYKVKLEYGHICTLYNEPVPNPTAELLKCQRFLEHFDEIRFSGMLFNAGNITTNSVTFTNKRIVPTISYKDLAGNTGKCSVALSNNNILHNITLLDIQLRKNSMSLGHGSIGMEIPESAVIVIADVWISAEL